MSTIALSTRASIAPARLPAAAGRYLAVVVALAVGAVAAAFEHGSSIGGHWPLFALLLVCGSLAQVFAVHTPANQVFHTGLVFTVVGALLLPPQLVVALCVGQHLADWLRQRYPWYIQTFNIANYTVSALAMSTVARGLSSAWSSESTNRFIAVGIVAAIAFVVVNHGLLAPMLMLARGHSGGLFSLDSLVTDTGLAGLGVVIALAWHAHSLGLVFVPVALLMIHRALTAPLTRALREHNEELEAHQAELEERVRMRTAALEAANRELDAFSYSVSHDLRAPLRAIDGFSQLVLSRHSHDLSPEGRHYLEQVTDGAKEMGRLIDGLLEFARLSQQPLSTRRVEVDPLVRDLVEPLVAEHADRTVEVSIGELPPATADPLLLRQVFANLLSNAFKYTRDREVARIEVDSYRADEGGVYLVRDNGAGFDMRYADRLFQVFQRLNGDDEVEGVGVGLALVAQIVRRHGGRVWADARPGEGATFSFTLGGG